MQYKQDCIYFISDRPCKFHKKNSSVICSNCKFYKKIGKKILVIKLSALGDVVRTTSVLQPIHKKWRNSKIYWITEDNAVEIFYNNPYVEKVIPLSNAFLLFNYEFDILINLDLDFTALSLTKNIFAKEKFGFYLDDNGQIVCSNKSAEEWFNLSHNDVLKKYNKKTYQEYLMEILGFTGLDSKDYPIIVNLTEDEKQFAKNWLANKLNTSNFSSYIFIGLNLGGGDKWKKKEYPVEQTVKLIEYIASGKSSKNVKILLFGGKKEKERNKKIVSLLSLRNISIVEKVLDTGTENSLRQFFALLNLCNVLITSDTLALHVALALKKKVIVLFGPTSANEIETYNLGIKIVSPKSCVCCYNQNCKKIKDCMNLISPLKVYKTLLHILSKKE